MVPKKNPLSYKRDSLYTYVAYVPLTSRKEVFFASSPTPLLATHSKAPESSALTFLTSRYRLSEVLVDTVLQRGRSLSQLLSNRGLRPNRHAATDGVLQTTFFKIAQKTQYGAVF